MMTKRSASAWAAGTSVVFLFVWQQLQSFRLGYEVERTRKLIDAEVARNAYLGLEVERRLSPDRIARAARERLRMRPPAPDALIVLGHEPPLLRAEPAAAPVAAARRASGGAAVASRGLATAKRWFLAAVQAAWEAGAAAQ